MVCWRSRMARINNGQMNFQQKATNTKKAAVWPNKVSVMFMLLSLPR